MKNNFAIVSDIDGVLILGPEKNLANGTIAQICEKNTPFYLLTNNGKVTEKEFITTMNKRFETNLDESQIILCHTPLRGLAQDFKGKVVLTSAPNELGSAKLAEEYGFEKHLNLTEYACVYPSIANFCLDTIPEFYDVFHDEVTGEKRPDGQERLEKRI